MIKRISLAAVAMAALTLPVLLSAGPASARGNPGPVAPPPSAGGGNCVGNTCTASVSSYIHLHGDVGNPAGHFVPVNLPPPPCRWVNYGDEVTGSHKIIDEFGDDPGTAFGVDKSVAQAKKLLKDPQPGEWYELPINPAAGEKGAAECLKLPLFVFVPPGQTPPPPPIPPETIAAYAYNHMAIPLPRVTVRPAAKGYVNLASYVWATWPVSRITGQEDTYEIVAEAGGNVVTVEARAQNLSVTATGPGRAYSAGCGPNGSRYPRGRAPASAGAGAPPDCGVLWTGPDSRAGISATARWTVTWWAADGVRHALPDIVVASPVTQMPVAEIQSINNGG